MHIIVAGGTGYLGRALVQHLRAQGRRVSVLTRSPKQPDHLGWPVDGLSPEWLRILSGTAALINLAGEPLTEGRWTDARKTAIRESRVQTTAMLVRAIVASPARPVLISGSAVGIYGTRGDDPRTEDSPAGSDFLAGVVSEWERAALAAAPSTRVVVLRSGVVLSRRGGALPQLARPFRFFVGGRVGSGDQYVSWIHLDDWIAMVDWAIRHPDVSGPLNATAPNPVTNAMLARAIGATLHRPALVPAPAFALRALLGEMADAAILNGQRVLPAKASALGFRFRYPTIERALAAIYDGSN